jgi:acyl dehydratase
MALAARQLYFEAVKVGDELPPLVKPPIDRIQIARYAGAAGDYNPLHVDEQFARNAGFPSVLVPPMLGMGFLAELVVDWLRGARLRRFQARFVKIVWPGDVLTCRGRVLERRFEGAGSYAAEIELWAENQRGELVVRGGVTAQLYYSAEDEAKQRAGHGPLVVTPQEEEARLAKLSRAQPPKAPPPPPPPPPKPAAKPAPAARPAAAAKPAAPAAKAPAPTVKAAPAPARPAAPAVKAAPAPARPAGPAVKAAPAAATPPKPAPVAPRAPTPPKPPPAAPPPTVKSAARASPAPARPAPKARPAAKPRPGAKSRPPKPARSKPKSAAPKAKPAARGRSGASAKPTPKKRR